MARYQVILSYDGTKFAGFQRQQRARTVQGVVEEALRRLGWQGKSLLSAGRTDTGVHASGQVIAFDLDWSHPVEVLLRALNATLPDDVAARQVLEAGSGFHPRYDALWRRYAYRLVFDPLRSPLQERYAWRVWPTPDLGQMRTAAQLLEGRHDFRSLGSPMKSGGSTVRVVHSAGWRDTGAGAVFDVIADAFLYHMVRHMVYLLVEIGQGQRSNAQLEAALENYKPLQGLAPAQGLVLEEVRYRQEKEDTLKTIAQGKEYLVGRAGQVVSGSSEE